MTTPWDRFLTAARLDRTQGILLPDDLVQAGFDTHTLSRLSDIALVKQKLAGRAAPMGNVAPLDLGVRGAPEQVYAAALEYLDKAAPGGGMILSFGGGVSPGTPPENIAALLRAAREWKGDQ